MGKQKTEEVRMLVCTLTEEEYRQKSEELTKLLREKAGHEAQKASSAKFYKELIDGDEHDIEMILPIVETGTEERNVKCRIDWNTPEKGLKTITRLDTMEKVATEEMTSDECQDMFLNQDTEDEPEAPAEELSALSPAEPEALPAPAEEVIDAEVIKCYKCGHNPGMLYHVSGDKAICEYCIDNIVNRNATKFFDENKHANGFEFRAQFGFGCTLKKRDMTCFRISNLRHGGSMSWGLNHYKIGDFHTPGTPAHEYAEYLKQIGGVEE